MKTYILQTNKDRLDFLATLQDSRIYKVEVAFSRTNIPHRAVLITGFTSTGSYCVVTSNTYEHIYTLPNMYSIKVVEDLASFD